MVEVPALIPVTSPVEDTVATAVFEDVHALAVAIEADPVSCVFNPTHTINAPVIVGNGFTVMEVVAAHPLKL